MNVLVALGHNSDNCVDPGVGRDYLGVEGSSDFKNLGKSLFFKIFIMMVKTYFVPPPKACDNLGIAEIYLCIPWVMSWLIL